MVDGDATRDGDALGDDALRLLGAFSQGACLGFTGGVEVDVADFLDAVHGRGCWGWGLLDRPEVNRPSTLAEDADERVAFLDGLEGRVEAELLSLGVSCGEVQGHGFYSSSSSGSRSHSASSASMVMTG